MIRIFIGFDPRESLAWHVLAHSIFQRATEPVSITPLCLGNLKKVFHRQRERLQSTDFSFTRFLVPHLCDYQGWAVFMDCDMLVRGDIAELWSLRDQQHAVMCVQHEHVPPEDQKFLGAIQTKYAKKNWSSMMLFNNERCKRLTPDYVNTASGLDLHQFKWLENDQEIGEIPAIWNHLVGYHPHDAGAKLVHFTTGGPYFNEYRDGDYANEWNDMLAQTTKVDQIA